MQNSTDESLFESQPAAAPESANLAPAAPAEKLIPESEVNNRIRHAVGRVREKTKEEMLASFQSQQSHQNQSVVPDSSPVISEDYVKNILDKTLAERFQNFEKEQNLQRGLSIAQEFMNKIYEGKEVFGDEFDNQMQLMGSSLPRIPEVVKLANEMPNTADVMHDLLKNPTKIATLLQVYQVNPDLALGEMKKISNALELNKKAGKVQLPNEPLTQIKQSNTGLENFDVHSRSVSDFRKIYR